ncbi:MAG TPA: DUF6671 family protein [Burkholderiaceae bacterium]|nr:DUF6671 family protein [Burkholderiaceae bacterium]
MSALGPRIASPWAGQTIYLPTLHGKGPTLTSVLAPTLGITQVQEVPVDTDKLGTFCGAVDRPNGPLFALATKIAAAKEMVPEGRLFMASEGSFRPHPTVPLQMVNLEWLKFADLDTGFECTVQSMTTTMENHERRVTHVDELHEALAPYRLPEHAVMVGLPGAPGVFFKALTTREQIAEAVATVLREHPVAELRSELRAHLNPTRLRHIRRLAMRLANRLRTACPKCAAPGFGEPLPRPGLPCATCGFPTSMPSGPAWQCQACHHIEHRKVKGKADPAFCPMCNR